MKIADHDVIVVREKKQQVIKSGTPFKFTDTEIEDIIAARGEDSLRDPVNEFALADGDKKETAAQKKARLAAEKKAADELAAQGSGESEGAGEGTGESNDGEDQL